MITLIGLGAGDADSLSRGAERALRLASDLHKQGRGSLFIRTELHPVVDTLREWDLQFETFDSLYLSKPDFTTLYQTIADRIINAAIQVTDDGRQFEVAYAVPGHPLFAEESVRQVLAGAKSAGIETRLVSSGSFIEAAFTASRTTLGVGSGFDVRDAQTMLSKDTIGRKGEALSGRIDSTRGLLIYHIHDRQSASQAKLALMRDYPDDWHVTLIRQAGVAGMESVQYIPLFQLDREIIDHLTSLYVPPLPPELKRPAFGELVGIMSRLRAEDGCPWDREQNHASLKKYFIEETYEVIEAIDADDPDLLCEELGDALLQVVFHAQLASEEGSFDIDDVTAKIVEKLVRRHPHVFGEVNVADSDEVLRNWEVIKRQEKTEQTANWRESILDGVPKGLPALMQAMEISKRVVKVGFEWANVEDILAKVDEELAELKAEIAAPTPDRDAIVAEMGDLFFTIVQIARRYKIDPEDALRLMLARFSKRFRYIEQQAKSSGRQVIELSPAEMDVLWEEAKKQ